MPGSLAYRKHAADIWNASPPEKYQRILPYVTGRKILEIGSAEGVLSLLLADRDPDAHITALELSSLRHAEAIALQQQWRKLGKRVDGCRMACGDIRDWSELLAGVETVVAVRTIYHLTTSIPDVFASVALAGVSTVVLCGNQNRARWPDCTQKAAALGEWNRYAGIDGMCGVLVAAGYQIATVVTEGDPIVVGRR